LQEFLPDSKGIAAETVRPNPRRAAVAAGEWDYRGWGRRKRWQHSLSTTLRLTPHCDKLRSGRL